MATHPQQVWLRWDPEHPHVGYVAADGAFLGFVALDDGLQAQIRDAWAASGTTRETGVHELELTEHFAALRDNLTSRLDEKRTRISLTTKAGAAA